MITIIVPIYKAEKYLCRCIDSIIAQKNSNWELLLVDDGSPDNSGDICDLYAKKDARIKVFHKPNGGVSSARNLGLDKAKGQWVTFIDADDYIDSLFCNIDESETNDVIIKQSRIVEIDLTISMPKAINSDINLVGTDQFLAENLHAKEFRVPWGKFFKSCVIKDVRFPIGQSIGEDTAFVLTVLARTRRIAYNSVGLYYWQRGENADSIKYKLSCKDGARFASFLFENYERTNIHCVGMERFILNYYFNLVDKSVPLETGCYFNTPIILKYYNKLNNQGMLSVSFRLWRSSPRIISSLIRIKRFFNQCILCYGSQSKS